jgi:two-component system chemotaxis response regulator CheY
MKKVLIADDSMFMRQMLKEILPEDKFEIAGEASTGKEAVEQYKKLMPDVVTMDITMPDMDGISAVQKIIEFDNKAKIIMVSAMGQKPMVKEALEAGAVDFIVKPFDRDRIVNTLSNI